MLEPADRAGERRVLGEILAVASCAGGQARALRGAIDRALTESGLSAEKVQFIIGAGNGDPRQDALEGRVLSEVFGGDRPPLLTSIKGTVGECLGGAGVMSMIAAVQSVRGGLLPPIRALKQTVDGLTLPTVSQRPAEVGPGVALICSVGQLGGAAAALLGF